MAVLSIDPGASTGGALTFAGSPSPRAFTLYKPSSWAIYRTIRWAKAQAETHGEKLELAVEGQFLGPNPQSMMSVVRAAERWPTIAELFGVPAIQIVSTTWQGPSFESVPTHERGRKLSTKQRSAILVQRLWASLEFCDGEPEAGPWSEIETAELPEDPCDAIVMGRWRIIGAGRTRPRAPKKRAKAKR